MARVMSMGDAPLVNQMHVRIIDTEGKVAAARSSQVLAVVVYLKY